MEIKKMNRNNGNKLKYKLFTERTSLLTELLEIKHFKTIRNVFLAALFGFINIDFISFLLNIGEFNFGLRRIINAFDKFHTVAVIWMLIFFINLLTYTCFNYWAKIRKGINPNTFYQKVWDILWLSVLFAYYLGSLYVMPIFIIKLELPTLSSVVVLCEQIRLIMKTHAFVRSNAPKVLNFKPHSDMAIKLPSFSNYIYFSFAPTLIYRDQYPRTSSINWMYAIRSFIEVFAIIWLQSFVFEKCFIQKFENYGKETTNWKLILISILENSFAGAIILVSFFYLLLHSWLNGCAEILRFADRKFYEDWWTTTNFRVYYRTWNIVVQDWLYTYVYKDLHEIVTPNNKVFPKFMVFLLSATIHEYILCFMLHVFFPLLFILFLSSGMLFTYIDTTNPIFNVFFLYSMALGMSLQLSLYTIEYFAKFNCQIQTTDNWFNPVIMASCFNNTNHIT